MCASENVLRLFDLCVAKLTIQKAFRWDFIDNSVRIEVISRIIASFTLTRIDRFKSNVAVFFFCFTLRYMQNKSEKEKESEKR